MLRDSDRATNCNKSVMSSDTDRSNHKQEERADGNLMFTFLICINIVVEGSRLNQFVQNIKENKFLSFIGQPWTEITQNG